ncbi:hypothetical protein [Kocuria sp. CNJ-770]|nr:hypothetical protein [Kocuria sp. CNJ-770]
MRVIVQRTAVAVILTTAHLVAIAAAGLSGPAPEVLTMAGPGISL